MRHENRALCNFPFRSRHGRGEEEGGGRVGMFIDLSHTRIVKRNFGTAL